MCCWQLCGIDKNNLSIGTWPEKKVIVAFLEQTGNGVDCAYEKLLLLFSVVFILMIVVALVVVIVIVVYCGSQIDFYT